MTPTGQSPATGHHPKLNLIDTTTRLNEGYLQSSSYTSSLYSDVYKKEVINYCLHPPVSETYFLKKLRRKEEGKSFLSIFCCFCWPCPPLGIVVVEDDGTWMKAGLIDIHRLLLLLSPSSSSSALRVCVCVCDTMEKEKQGRLRCRELAREGRPISIRCQQLYEYEGKPNNNDHVRMGGGRRLPAATKGKERASCGVAPSCGRLQPQRSIVCLEQLGIVGRVSSEPTV